MLNRIFKSVLVGVFSLVLCTNFTACKKEKKAIGVIIVKYSNGEAAEGAEVRLYPDSALSLPTHETISDLDKTNPTDANGRAEFTYDLEAILNVDIVKYKDNDTLVGSNIIRLLKGKTVTKVVEIN